MKKFYKISLSFFILFSGFYISVFAQNIVPNPSFEDYSFCPNYSGQVYKAIGWSSYGNSPDYFNLCSSSILVSVPNNSFGNQCATTGNGYCGFYSYVPFNNYREFIGIQLTSQLCIGEKYYISFKINVADNFNCATNKLGVLFSTIHYNDTIIAPINNFAHFFIDSIIIDSINWTNISGSFVADSAYQYIIIGNFFDNLNTDSILFSGNFCNSYYFVDNICVSIDSLTCINIKDQIINFWADTVIIQEGNCINFNINTVVDYVFYEWQFQGATPNISNDSIPTNICYNTSGIYPVTLIVSDSSGCGDTITKTNYIIVNELNDIVNYKSYENQINISPNPSKDIVIIKVNNRHYSIIEIYNSLGELVSLPIEKNLQKNIYKINFINQPSGIYFIKLLTGKEVITKKIIKL